MYNNKYLLFLYFILIGLINKENYKNNSENACASPVFIPSQDPSSISNARCSDLIIYPINAVDQTDQYRFDYSDVGFGNTHALGASVTVTCTTDGQPATVEGFDQQRASITSSPALIASCSQVEGSQSTWTVHAKILQFVDCRA
uniref:C6 domain-containing protein n=1 Tax=Meloidogyne hapla TaxID=6305 RepID=A0A1I8C3T2_MELHA